jgi:N-acetylglutamate synthase-like GNAT family acetyltransferase
MELDMKTGAIQSLIRSARPHEGEALSALALRSKAHWGYDAAFMAACVDELTVSAESIQKNPTYVVEAKGRILGFYMLESPNGREIELGYLFVEPDVIGKGYGSQLMCHAKGKALELGYQAMFIQGDPNAESFYRSMGGKKIADKPSSSILGRELPLFKIDLV